MIKRLILLFVLTVAAFGQNSNYPDISLSRQCPTDTGSGTAYVVTETPALAALQTGTEICFLPANANTGTTPTVNVNGLGAKTITKFGTKAVAPSDLITTAQAVLRYDGTGFELQNPQTNITLQPVVNTTAVTAAANSTSPQQLMELSLSAGYLNSANLATLIHSSGIFSTTLTPSVTITFKLCTVSACGSGTVVNLGVLASAATVTGTNNQFSAGLSCATKTTGATGNLLCHGVGFVDLTSGSVLTTPYSDANTATSSNIDLTAALFLDTFVTFSSGSTSNTMTDQLMFIAPPSGNVGTSGASGAVTILTKTANYTTASTDFSSATTAATEVVYTVSSATTVTHTLPNTVTTSGTYQLVRNDCASGWGLYVLPANSLTLDGDTTQIFLPPCQTITITSNGTNWISSLATNRTSIVGGALLPILYNTGPLASANVFVTTTVETPYATQFILDKPIKVSQITISINTGVAACVTDAAIADQGGNIITHISGGTVCTGAANTPASASPVITLAPGVYYAAGCANTNVTLLIDAIPLTKAVFQYQQVKLHTAGLAANLCTAGVFTNTALGAITNSTVPSSVPTFWVNP